MRISEKAKTPDGVPVQLEDWGDFYLIGAYPVAKNYGRYELIKRGSPFRLTIKTSAPFSDFDNLKTGAKTIEDMAGQFWDGERDKFYLGMDTEYFEVAHKATVCF